MATTLSKETDLSLCFSSMLPDAVFDTTADRVRIALYPGKLTITSPTAGLQSLIDVTLYPYGGRVTLRSVRDTVEAYCLDKGETLADFSYMVWDSLAPENANPGCYNFSVLYCAYATATAVGDFTAASALTTRSRFVVPRGRDIGFSFYHGAESVKLVTTAVVKDPDGTVRTDTTSGEMTFDAPGIEDILRAEEEIANGQVLSARISAGARSVAFYFTDAVPRLTFRFRNAFNVWEYCDLWCVTTEKPEASRQFAQMEGEMVPYDEQLSKEYEVQTTALPAEESYWMEQLLFSYEVRLVLGSASYDNPRVLITDSTIEPHDNDAETVTVKFTWRFADTRPRLHSLIDGQGGIFTTQFNSVFK